MVVVLQFVHVETRDVLEQHHGLEVLAVEGAVHVHRDEGVTALLRQMGPFPLWRGEEPLEEALEPVYRAVREKYR